MKKVLSIILSLIMLLSITAGIDFSAYANTNNVLISKTITIKNEDDEEGFSFTPKESGVYYFYSTGDYDTYGEVSEDDYIYGKDDDSGEGFNFKVTCMLKANTEYDFNCYIQDSSTGTFNVFVEKANFYNNGEIKVGETKQVSIDDNDSIVYFTFTALERGKYYFYSTGNVDTLGYVWSEDNDRYVNDNANYTDNFEIICYFEAGVTYTLACKLVDDYTGDEHSFKLTLSETDYYNGGPTYSYVYDGEISLNEEKTVDIERMETDDSYECHVVSFVPEKSGIYYFSSVCGDLVGYIYDEDMQLLAEEFDNGCKSGSFCIKYYFETGVKYNLVWRRYKSSTGGTSEIALTENGYIYTLLDDGTARIDDYVGLGGEVEIPSVINNYKVTEINEYAFVELNKITKVVIPDSVTKICDNSFRKCENLISVIIPNSVTDIGNGAFQACKSLVSVTIPDSVINFGDYVFYNCTSLNSISVDSNNVAYLSKDGVLFNKSMTDLICYPAGKKSDNYVIPNSVKNISSFSMATCEKLKSVTIGESVTNIESRAFLYCTSLTSIKIGKNVKNIGDSTFQGCYYLVDISLGEGVKSIGEYAFAYCYALESIVIPSSVVSIGGGAFFWDENLKSITVLNPNCNMEHFGYLGESPLTIIGYENSTAETYAKEYDLTFKSLGVYKCSNHTYKTTTTKATTSKNGSKVTKCTVCGDVKSKSTIYYPKTITLSATTYTYNGKAQKPTVTVKDSKGNKIATSNYTVSYASGCKNVGSYKVTIKFKGNYSGTVTKTFKINPKGTTISKLTATSKGFKATWKKQATQTTGYQIRYSTKSNMSGAKTVTVSKNSTTSKTISKLSAKKKYYVQIRTYKTVNGTKYYSSWSGSKTVTTKK
jgi:hypothetical protein